MGASAKTARRPPGAARATFPVVEIFGPTIQGEGPDAGQPAYFVRFGGCDWRCTWCDSMHAVDPALVRAHAQRLSVGDILDRLDALDEGPRLVVLSGGNPALLRLGELVDALRRSGKQVAVETQGSVWRDWLRRVDRLVISPKPPSSGMATAEHAALFAAFVERLGARGSTPAALKVAIFDKDDLDWAQGLHLAYPSFAFYLSAGTDVDVDEPQAIAAMRERYRWLCEAVAARRPLAGCRVLPQLHVVAWGTAKGV